MPCPVGRTTIANILKRNGIDPAPDRGTRMTWSRFLKAHWAVLSAADFFTVEVWGLRGLVTLYIQVGRNLTDPVDGFLVGKEFVILDRDSKYSSAFRDLLEDAGVQIVRLPPRSPNLNAYAERFVRSIKGECLHRMIFVGERSLRKATREYAAHYHGERNHQGIDNRLIDASDRAESTVGAIECVQRLGGMLCFYHRAAA